MEKEKLGMSLIVLVITILVMLILAGVVIVGLADNNPIEKSIESVFKTDISSYKSQLTISKATLLSQNPHLRVEEVNAYGEEMKLLISSLKENHSDKFKIEKSNIVYIGNDRKEAIWCYGIIDVEGINVEMYTSNVEDTSLDRKSVV